MKSAQTISSVDNCDKLVPAIGHLQLPLSRCQLLLAVCPWPGLPIWWRTYYFITTGRAPLMSRDEVTGVDYSQEFLTGLKKKIRYVFPLLTNQEQYSRLIKSHVEGKTAKTKGLGINQACFLSSYCIWNSWSSTYSTEVLQLFNCNALVLPGFAKISPHSQPQRRAEQHLI